MDKVEEKGSLVSRDHAHRAGSALEGLVSYLRDRATALRPAAELLVGDDRNWVLEEVSDCERWANAAEAAPDLLEALKFVSTDPCFKLLGSVTHDEVRAAISKAEGR